jgi:hypothetical protein
VATLQLSGLDGVLLGPAVPVTIPADGQVAKFVRELFPALASNFRGFLTVTAPSPIGMTGLRARYNERQDFLITTTPPWDGNTSSSNSELLFPHILSGGGFTTQFILYGESGPGKMWVISRDGTLLTGENLSTSP